MVLKRFHSTLFIFVILFSAVHNRKVKRSTPDFSDIVKNISSVNSLLQNVIRNYKELEKLAKSTEEKDFRTDLEIKQLFEVETSKKIEDTITTKSNTFVGTPLFYSDESWRDGDSETIEKSENDQKNYELARTDSREFTTAFAVKIKHAQGRNFKDDAESNGDKKSDEISQLDAGVKSLRNKEHKKIVVVTKEASGKQSKLKGHSFKSNPQRVPPVNIKILQTTKVHDSNSDDEKVMINEVLRADYLRDAYIDACKMVTIRKCRRALRAVSKDVCSRGRKCAQKFKDDFRQNGMSACDSQFTNRTSACRSGVDYDDTEVPDRRLLNVMIPTKEPRANNSKDAKAIARTQQMNVLRDRYEKACKKDSFKKCKAACKYSYTKTCKKYECANAKKKLFKKSCKRRCKESFGVTGGDSDDSGSSDGSGGSGGGGGSGSGSGS